MKPSLLELLLQILTTYQTLIFFNRVHQISFLIIFLIIRCITRETHICILAYHMLYRVNLFNEYQQKIFLVFSVGEPFLQFCHHNQLCLLDIFRCEWQWRKITIPQLLVSFLLVYHNNNESTNRFSIIFQNQIFTEQGKAMPPKPVAVNGTRGLQASYSGSGVVKSNFFR